MSSKPTILDLGNNPSTFYLRQGKDVLWQAYEDMLFPGQENVFRGLSVGQEVRIKNEPEIYLVDRILHEPLPGEEDHYEVKLTLRLKDDDETQTH